MPPKAAYPLLDDPVPSRLENMAVRPLFPLLATMMAGAWFGWSWFALNAFAMGSPTRWRECAWLAGGVVFSLAYIVAIGVATVAEMPKEALPYALLGLTVLRLGVSYHVCQLQSETFELRAHFGAPSSGNGGLLVVLGIVLRQLLPPIVLVVLG